MPAKINDAQHVVEQLSRRADKRLAGQVLLLARAFADEENLCILRPDAEDDIVPRLAQGAHRALQADASKLVPGHGAHSFLFGLNVVIIVEAAVVILLFQISAPLFHAQAADSSAAEI